MKTLTRAVIEEGVKLLDVATFAEFEAFAVKNLTNERERKALLTGIRKLVTSDNRGHAISMWRRLAEEWEELEPGVANELARQMLRDGKVTSLSSAELRRTEQVWAALCAASITKGAPELVQEGAELYFALAVTAAKKFEAVAQDLGVKLP